MASKALCWSSSPLFSSTFSCNRNRGLGGFGPSFVSFPISSPCKSSSIKTRPLGLINIIRAQATGNNKDKPKNSHNIPINPAGNNSPDTSVPVRQSTGRLPADISPFGTWDIPGTWDIHHEEKIIMIKYQMPGLSKKDVYVAVDEANDVLVIEGKNKSQSISYNTWLRLPQSCKKNEIKADFKDGLLLITIPLDTSIQIKFDI